MEKDKKKTDIAKLAQTILVYAVSLVAMIVIISMKKNYHVDEMLSYTLANNLTGWFDFYYGTTYDSAELFRANYSADTYHMFNYPMVWSNQASDCHPPLYYAILHTICSITKGVVSDFQVGLINVVFCLLTIFLMRKILRLLWQCFVKDRKEDSIIIDIISMVFALMPGVLNNVSFFRMYVMAMCMVTWSTYSLLNMVRLSLSDEKVKPSDIANLFFSTYLAVLTHHYCTMYLVIINLTVAVVILFNKNMKVLLWQVGISLAAALCGLGTFPAMINQVLSSDRGEDVKENLASVSSAAYMEQLKEFFRMANKNLFGGLLPLLLVGLIVAVVLGFVLKNDRNKNRELVEYLLIMLIPSIGYMLILSKITVYLDQRYLFPLYGVLYAALALSVIMALIVFVKNRFALIGICAAVSVLSLVIAYNKPEFLFLYRDNTTPEAIAENYEDLDSIVLSNSGWRCVTLYKILTNNVTFSREDDHSSLYNAGLIDLDEAIVYVLDEAAVQSLVAEMPNVENYDTIGGHLYFTAYHVY